MALSDSVGSDGPGSRCIDLNLTSEAGGRLELLGEADGVRGPGWGSEQLKAVPGGRKPKELRRSWLGASLLS